MIILGEWYVQVACTSQVITMSQAIPKLLRGKIKQVKSSHYQMSSKSSQLITSFRKLMSQIINCCSVTTHEYINILVCLMWNNICVLPNLIACVNGWMRGNNFVHLIGSHFMKFIEADVHYFTGAVCHIKYGGQTHDQESTQGVT